MKQDPHAFPTPSIHDRLAARSRPNGLPVMHQSWDKLLFVNWAVPADEIRPFVPRPLSIDTFDDKAWLTLTPLTISGLRRAFLPSVPYLSRLHELNLRTYVHYEGVPGVWFFSLDANNLPAVVGARMLFSLPYFSAEIDMRIEDDQVAFLSERKDKKVRFKAKWLIGPPMSPAEPDTVVFFLSERYSLYASDGNDIYRCRIHHVPWPLQTTSDLSELESSVAMAAGLPEVAADPMRFCGGPVDVEVWPLEKVAQCLS